MLVRLRGEPPHHLLMHIHQVRKYLEEAALPTQGQRSEHSCVSLQTTRRWKAFLQALKQMLHGRLKLSRDSCHRVSPVRCHLARAAPLAQRGHVTWCGHTAHQFGEVTKQRQARKKGAWDDLGEVKLSACL